MFPGHEPKGHTHVAFDSTSPASVEQTDPPAPPTDRLHRLADFPAEATLTELDATEKTHVSAAIPDTGLCLLVVVGDIVDEVRILRACADRFGSTLPIISAGPAPDVIGTTFRQYCQYARNIGRAGVPRLMSRELGVILGVGTSLRNICNAVILFKDGRVVWERVSKEKRDVPSLGLDDLAAAIARHAPKADD